jgi:fructosamine-3-kinase
MVSRLRELIPAAPASLLHGDLWSGNVLADATGAPCLIDPFTHFGFPETDLSMTLLFGGFGPSFHGAWEEEMRPVPGWRSRAEIHNVVHLLNHLHLFGPEYLDAVERTLAKFGS